MSTLSGPKQPSTADVFSSTSSPSTPPASRSPLQVSNDGWRSPLKPAGDSARGTPTLSPVVATATNETATRPERLPTAKVKLPDSFDPFENPKTPDTSQRTSRPALKRADSARYDWSTHSSSRPGEANATTDHESRAWLNRPFNPVVGSRHQPNTPRTDYLTPPPSTRKPLNPSAEPFVQVNANPSSIRTVPQVARSGGNSESTQASWTWPRQSKAGTNKHAGPSAFGEQLVPVYEDAELATPTRSGGTFSNLAASPGDKSTRSAQLPLATRYVYLQNLLPSLNEETFGAIVKTRYDGLSLRGCFTGHLVSLGHAVLVFSDVRDSLRALKVIESDFDFSATVFANAQFLARCITPQAFEQLAGSAGQNPLISASEGVVVATIRGPQTAVSPDSTFATFGEIRSLKSVDRMTYFVEYWDDRAAEAALRYLGGRKVATTKFECTFEPSIATSHISTSEATLDHKEIETLGHCGRPSISSHPPEAADLKATLPGVASAHSISEDSSVSEQRAAPAAGFLATNTSARVEAAPRTNALATPVRDSPPDASSESSSARTVRGGSRLPAKYGLVRDDKIPLSNMINFARIEQGLDFRTTLMIKNIPNKLKDIDVMANIDEVVGRAYDFFYLRCDYSNDCNVGYGFVNFVSTAALLDFARARLGTRWNMCGSDKLCVLSYANIQGKSALIRHFKNSSVLDQNENRRPKLFVTSGPNAGRPEPFPACDDPIRKARSAMNASNVGLFPSSKPVFKIAHALQGLRI